MSQTPPTTLGKYQIIREIARSNDIVYEAWDPVMNRRVAVKELAVPGGSSDKQKQERLQRFHREARAAGGLVHPNIVTIYEVTQEGDRHFIAMEYLDGRNLRQEMDSAGALPPLKAIETAIEVLKGLSFSHSKGVVHRDIKPDNIQLLTNGSVKITDFGIARLTFEPNLTMDGQVFGTPSYMSPEQIHGKEIDARSDLFSVGVILYEMVAGAKPFTGDSVVSITYSIMNTQPQPPAQAIHSLWMVISRALDKSPQMRPASADEMRGMLEAVRDEIRTGGAPRPSVTAAFAPPAHSVASGPPPILYSPQPVAPPSYSPPAHQPGQVYSQPYVPGGGHTSPGTFPPSSGGTPYNPYGQPSLQLPNGVPIYYPPTPKQPIFTPEVKQVFAKLALSLLILGTIVGLAILVVNSAARGSSSAEPVPTSAAPGGMSPGQASALAETLSRETRDLAERPAWENLRDPIWEQSRRWQDLAASAGAGSDGVRQAAATSFIYLAEARRDMGDSYGGRVAIQHAISFGIGHDDLLSRSYEIQRQLGG